MNVVAMSKIRNVHLDICFKKNFVDLFKNEKLIANMTKRQ